MSLEIHNCTAIYRKQHSRYIPGHRRRKEYRRIPDIFGGAESLHSNPVHDLFFPGGICIYRIQEDGRMTPGEWLHLYSMHESGGNRPYRFGGNTLIHCLYGIALPYPSVQKDQISVIKIYICYKISWT